MDNQTSLKNYIVEYTIKCTQKTPQYEGLVRYSLRNYPSIYEIKLITNKVLEMFGLPITTKNLKLVQPFKIYEEKSSSKCPI